LGQGRACQIDLYLPDSDLVFSSGDSILPGPLILGQLCLGRLKVNVCLFKRLQQIVDLQLGQQLPPFDLVACLHEHSAHES